MDTNKTGKDKQKAKEELRELKEQLKLSMAPYFAADGRLDLNVKNPSLENGDLLARLLNYTLVNEGEMSFEADTIVARQVIIDSKKRMRFWGRIFWLTTPKDYYSFKPGYDPFYGEFILENNTFKISTLKFGDNKNTNIDKVWWYNMDLDWKYEFEA